jgi:hypothetical protein
VCRSLTDDSGLPAERLRDQVESGWRALVDAGLARPLPGAAAAR